MQGWVSIYRSLLSWQWFHRPEMVQLWVYLLLKANHAPASWQGVEIKRGQLVTSRPTITKETGLSDRQIRTAVKNLKNTGEIQTHATNRFSIITICNYASYQDEGLKSDRQATDKTAKSDQQKSTKATDKKSPEPIASKGTGKATDKKATDKKQEKRPAKPQKATTNNNNLNNKDNRHELLKIVDLFPSHLRPKNNDEVEQWQRDYLKLKSLNYTHQQIYSALNYALNDKFWKPKVMNIKKLINKNKDGIRYIDFFQNQIEPKNIQIEF